MASSKLRADSVNFSVGTDGLVVAAGGPAVAAVVTAGVAAAATVTTARRGGAPVARRDVEGGCEQREQHARTDGGASDGAGDVRFRALIRWLRVAARCVPNHTGNRW